MRRISVLFAVLLILGATVPNPVRAAEMTAMRLLISEVKLGESRPVSVEPAREFVSIYNPSGQAVSLEGWRLEHAKAGFPTEQCSSIAWDGALAKSYDLAGVTIGAGTSVSVAVSLTDNAAGAVRLTKDEVVQDTVGWLGKDGEHAPCAEDAEASWPAAGTSIQRMVQCDDATVVDSDNNSRDFALHALPATAAIPGTLLPGCSPAPSPEDELLPGDEAASCSGVIISELLPNPSGSDIGQEFIELYNPSNSAVSLANCRLQTTANSKEYTLTGWLAPGAYMILDDDTTGLTMTNGAGGTVYLLEDDVELVAVTYPGAMADDTSWAWVSGSQWEISYAPTPGGENIRQAHEPCAADESYDAATGKCHDISASAGANLMACRPGQERNPDTNRCRAIATAATSTGMTPCRPGQVRNIETNRCRAAATTASALKPCAAGWERNIETNRCRKLTNQADGLAKIDEAAVPTGAAAQWQWWIAGIAATGAGGYGLYEWRGSVRRFLDKIRGVPGKP